jgi:hypothetical protein
MYMSTDDFFFDIDAFMAEVAEAEKGPSEEAVAKLLPRIRKMLNLAENAGTKAEADAFNVKAARLISKYGLDALLLANTEPKQPRAVANRWITVSGPYVDDRGRLLSSVVRALGARCVYLDAPGCRRYHVFGTEPDLVRIELLFTSLLVQMQRDLTQALAEQPRGGTSKTIFSRDFMAGYRSIIYRRLEGAEDNARAEAETERGETPGSEGTSVALALYNRDAAVERAVKEVYPKTKTVRRKPRAGLGVLAGMEAGKRANLGGTGLPASTGRSIGGSR